MTASDPAPVVGVDVAAVVRIARALRRHPSFARRCFTVGEASTSGTRPERWAGRWAVKEAVRKVYGGRGWAIPAYRLIEVRRAPGQAPTVAVAGREVPGLAVSLTHDAGVAIAVAVHIAPATSAQPDMPLAAGHGLRLPDRPTDAHKGTFGTVLVLAGHRLYPGAPVLCSLGALRGGAGKVRAVVPAGPGGLALFPPEVIVRGVGAGESGGFAPAALAELVDDLATAQAIAVGPGLGQAEETGGFLMGLFARLTSRATPLVLDADGLNLCARDPELLARVPPGAVCTPHPAELARLLGRTVDAVQADRTGAAAELAVRLDGVVVLKGAGTVIAAADGALDVDPHATAALAVGGSGDVLTGLVAALLAQGLSPLDAARSGVFIHAEAGSRLAAGRGRSGLLASEIAAACVEAQERLRRVGEATERE
ncbi:MAG TPA: NAD(P)H-hydrate dehydratase [Verrucomicrobiae bacterium]|nr:NAD(P)H-hydrate dehydratase [Verrucomicrobiae bacterium]